MNTALVGILLAALWSTGRGGWSTAVGSVLGITGFVASWFAADDRVALIVFHVAYLTFFILIAGRLLSYVLGPGRVDGTRVAAAVSAYTIIGLAAGFVFSFMAMFRPDAFGDATPAMQVRDFVYFGFVTLTTVGYGDITPVWHPARSFATFVSIGGQMYLTVLVARLVGLSLAHAEPPRAVASQPDSGVEAGIEPSG